MEMVDYLKDHPEEFDSAVHLALADKQYFSWRAAWILWSSMEENDKRIAGHVEKIIRILPSRQDNHKRDLLMILQKMDISEEIEGELFDICIGIWEQIGKSPSVRINAFKMLLKIIRKHPELSNEIIYLIEPHYIESLTKGAKHSLTKLIIQFKKDFNLN
jgi:hypothetical protein